MGARHMRALRFEALRVVVALIVLKRMLDTALLSTNSKLSKNIKSSALEPDESGRIFAFDITSHKDIPHKIYANSNVSNGLLRSNLHQIQFFPGLSAIRPTVFLRFESRS